MTVSQTPGSIAPERGDSKGDAVAATPATPKIAIRNLYKVFGERPERALEMLKAGKEKGEIFEQTGLTVGVHDASFEVYEGEIFVVMGLSGSGKSTLVRLLNRLIEPTSGEVLVDGRDITKMSEAELRDLRRQDMSMVFQSFALMPHMTVLENAAFGLELAGMGKDERRTRALQALEQVGLTAWANSKPNQLSGGMQQRVGLARALAADPSIMLMDEAFSALDPLIRAEMQDELLKLQDESRRTIIFISHDLDEAMRIGDRIAVMQGGSVVQVGTPDDLLRSPANDYVRSFFRGVDVSKVLTAEDIARKDQVTVIDRADYGVRTALRRLEDYDREYGFVIDKKGIYHGTVTLDSLRAAIKAQDEPRFSHSYVEMASIAPDTLLNDLYAPLAESRHPLPVVDENGRYRGAISKNRLLRALDSTGEA